MDLATKYIVKLFCKKKEEGEVFMDKLFCH